VVLTGPEIERQVAQGKIEISPFEQKNVGPNSLDLRLHPELLVYGDLPYGPGFRPHPPPLSMSGENPTPRLTIPEEGLVLVPGTLYLGRTVEKIHTRDYVMKVDGRSSVGRLGMQIHATAGFIDTGFRGTITLEMSVIHPVRVLPNVRICQIWFMGMTGAPRLYLGRYQDQEEATPSRFHEGKATVW